MKHALKFFLPIALIFICFTSCNQKEVKLPVLNVSGIQDTIYDNSQIWIFLKLHENDTVAELNRKNAISSTNWIYNIDKKLTLHQIVPHLIKMIKKRKKQGMHPKDEDDTNYFSYVDSGSKKLSMVQFDDINYITDKRFELTKFKNDSVTKHLSINCTKSKFSINDSIIDIAELKNYINHQSTSLKLHLSFDKHLSYKDYLYLKANLQNIKNDSIHIDMNEYVN